MRQTVGVNNFSESIAEVPPIDHVYDATANDSDKIFAVPSNEMWKLNFAHVLLVSSGTAGNRTMLFEVADADSNVIIDIEGGASQAAGLTRHYIYFQGIYRETSFNNGEIQVPIPIDLYLPPEWSIRFYDSAAVDAAADDMTVSFQYQKLQV